MCVIIDTNVTHKILLRDNDPDFHYLHSCIFPGRKGKKKHPKVIVCYGGSKLRREYAGKASRILAELDRAGRARAVDDSRVDKEAKRLADESVCVSDDEHIIALARIGGVRLLCTEDGNDRGNKLQQDFKNKSLLDNPRGRIYKGTQHNGLLRHYCQEE